MPLNFKTGLAGMNTPSPLLQPQAPDIFDQFDPLADLKKTTKELENRLLRKTEEQTTSQLPIIDFSKMQAPVSQQPVYGQGATSVPQLSFENVVQQSENAQPAPQETSQQAPIIPQANAKLYDQAKIEDFVKTGREAGLSNEILSQKLDEAMQNGLFDITQPETTTEQPQREPFFKDLHPDESIGEQALRATYRAPLEVAKGVVKGAEQFVRGGMNVSNKLVGSALNELTGDNVEIPAFLSDEDKQAYLNEFVKKYEEIHGKPPEQNEIDDFNKTISTTKWKDLTDMTAGITTAMWNALKAPASLGLGLASELPGTQYGMQAVSKGIEKGAEALAESTGMDTNVAHNVITTGMNTLGLKGIKGGTLEMARGAKTGFEKGGIPGAIKSIGKEIGRETKQAVAMPFTMPLGLVKGVFHPIETAKGLGQNIIDTGKAILNPVETLKKAGLPNNAPQIQNLNKAKEIFKSISKQKTGGRTTVPQIQSQQEQGFNGAVEFVARNPETTGDIKEVAEVEIPQKLQEAYKGYSDTAKGSKTDVGAEMETALRTSLSDELSKFSPKTQTEMKPIVGEILQRFSGMDSTGKRTPITMETVQNEIQLLNQDTRNSYNNGASSEVMNIKKLAAKTAVDKANELLGEAYGGERGAYGSMKAFADQVKNIYLEKAKQENIPETQVIDTLGNIGFGYEIMRHMTNPGFSSVYAALRIGKTGLKFLNNPERQFKKMIELIKSSNPISTGLKAPKSETPEATQKNTVETPDVGIPAINRNIPKNTFKTLPSTDIQTPSADIPAIQRRFPLLPSGKSPTGEAKTAGEGQVMTPEGESVAIIPANRYQSQKEVQKAKIGTTESNPLSGLSQKTEKPVKDSSATSQDNLTPQEKTRQENKTIQAKIKGQITDSENPVVTMDGENYKVEFEGIDNTAVETYVGDYKVEVDTVVGTTIRDGNTVIKAFGKFVRVPLSTSIKKLENQIRLMEENGMEHNYETNRLNELRDAIKQEENVIQTTKDTTPLQKTEKPVKEPTVPLQKNENIVKWKEEPTTPEQPTKPTLQEIVTNKEESKNEGKERAFRELLSNAIKIQTSGGIKDFIAEMNWNKMIGYARKGDNKSLSNMLTSDNKNLRKVFENMTGLKIGKDITQKEIASSTLNFAEMAIERIKSAEREQPVKSSNIIDEIYKDIVNNKSETSIKEKQDIKKEEPKNESDGEFFTKEQDEKYRKDNGIPDGMLQMKKGDEKQFIVSTTGGDHVENYKGVASVKKTENGYKVTMQDGDIGNSTELNLKDSQIRSAHLGDNGVAVYYHRGNGVPLQFYPKGHPYIEKNGVYNPFTEPLDSKFGPNAQKNEAEKIEDKISIANKITEAIKNGEDTDELVKEFSNVRENPIKENITVSEANKLEKMNSNTGQTQNYKNQQDFIKSHLEPGDIVTHNGNIVTLKNFTGGLGGAKKWVGVDTKGNIIRNIENKDISVVRFGDRYGQMDVDQGLKNLSNKVSSLKEKFNNELAILRIVNDYKKKGVDEGTIDSILSKRDKNWKEKINIGEKAQREIASILSSEIPKFNKRKTIEELTQTFNTIPIIPYNVETIQLSEGPFRGKFQASISEGPNKGKFAMGATEEQAKSNLDDIIAGKEVKREPTVKTETKNPLGGLKKPVKSNTNKLRETADSVISKAEETLGASRNENTNRRASMADNARERARQDLALGNTMKLIADAIDSGNTEKMSNVSSKQDVSRLQSAINVILHRYIRDKNINQRDLERNPQKVTDEMIDRYTETPGRVYHHVSGSDMNSIFTPSILRAGTMEGLDLKTLKEELKRGNYINVLLFENEISFLASKGKGNNDFYQIERLKESLTDEKALKKISGGNTQDEVEIGLKKALKEYNNIRNGVSTKETKEEQLKREERDLAMKTNIPGFFPTPEKTVSEMIDIAQIKPGMKVLEPSAGLGHIADKIKEKGVNPDVIELNNSLSSHLEKKGHNVIGSDFMELPENAKYDRIIMNPPFEKLQDTEHVMKAYDHLNPGGRIVSIMGEGAFGNSLKKASDFREWLDSVGGTSEKLPEGTFKESLRQTGVNTRMVIIDKPKENTSETGKPAERQEENGNTGNYTPKERAKNPLVGLKNIEPKGKNNSEYTPQFSPKTENAFNWTSFDPRRRENSSKEEYKRDIDNAYKELLKESGSPEKQKILDELMPEFEKRYVSALNAYYSSHGRLASPMIAGPAKFPFAKMEKLDKTVSNKLTEANEIYKKGISYIKKKMNGIDTEGISELEQMKAKLEEETKQHEYAIAYNKIIKSKSDISDKIEEVKRLTGKNELSKDMVEIITQGETVPSFTLTNSRNRIKHYEQRVKELSQKEILKTEQEETGEAKTEKIGNIELVHNAEADRIQMKFEGKPDEETRAKLRGRGFLWSPKHQAWQRKLTKDGIYYARKLANEFNGTEETKNPLGGLGKK